MKKGQINIGYKARKVGFMDGNEKLIGLADRYSTIDYKSIIAYAAKAAAVPESSIEMAMEAIYDAMNYFVLNGHSVQIPNMGTFSLGISAKTAATEAEFTAKIDHISACPENRLIFHFKDGMSAERTWQERSRSESWTEEMKEQARLAALRRYT